MPIDLTTLSVHDEGSDEWWQWVYAHATLQRLFRDEPDDRDKYFNQVPTLVNWHRNPSIAGGTLPNTSIYADHFLLETTKGWVNILGGTKLLGWPQHVLSALAPALIDPYFPTYWLDLADTALAVIATKIPAGDARPICFSGHSLGGAASVTAAYRDWTRTPERSKTCISFGCPKVRGKQGMDGRDFLHVRMMNEYDPIPYLPFNPFPVRIFLRPIRSGLSGLHHYGLPVLMKKNRPQYRFSDGRWINPLGLAGLFFTGILDEDLLFTHHFMAAYAKKIREIMAREGIRVDPFWDRANRYINQLEGIRWHVFNYYPNDYWDAPPATPKPNPVDLEDVCEKAADLIDNAQRSLWTPGPNLQIRQSFAAYLAAQSGRDFRDVTVRLATNIIPEGQDVLLADLQEATFPGYTPVGGADWDTLTPPAGFAQRRWARRAIFSCWSAVVPNDVWAMYLVAHEGPAETPVLIAWQQFGAAVKFDKERKGLFLSIEVSGA